MNRVSGSSVLLLCEGYGGIGRAVWEVHTARPYSLPPSTTLEGPISLLPPDLRFKVYGLGGLSPVWQVLAGIE